MESAGAGLPLLRAGRLGAPHRKDLRSLGKVGVLLKEKGPQKLVEVWDAPHRKRASEASGRLGCPSQKEGLREAWGRLEYPL